jgi:hypothetical protein
MLAAKIIEYAEPDQSGPPIKGARLFAVLEFALAPAPILKDKVITFFDVCSIFSLHYHYNL